MISMFQTMELGFLRQTQFFWCSSPQIQFWDLTLQTDDLKIMWDKVCSLSCIQFFSSTYKQTLETSKGLLLYHLIFSQSYPITYPKL